jgi:hypothetical protein
MNVTKRLLSFVAATPLLLLGCGSDRTGIIVQNRTTVPIYLPASSGLPGANVPACGSVTLKVGETAATGSPDPNAVVVTHRMPISADAAVHYVVVVTSKGASDALVDSAASLPPCEGVPPPE